MRRFPHGCRTERLRPEREPAHSSICPASSHVVNHRRIIAVRPIVDGLLLAPNHSGRSIVLETRLTEMLKIRHPIMLAGMAGVSYAELVAAVSEAGGYGVLGAGNMTLEE